MRVVAGSLGGRTFDAPPGHRTHPMSDKVRGALFNALGDIEGLTVLDAYAGSGALSFEALSRGAASSVAIDIDKGANRTIVNNVAKLGLGGLIQSIQAGVTSWSETNADIQFDLVFADPPYDDVTATQLERLAAHAKTGGLVVYSLPPRATFRLAGTEFELLSHKNYGDAELWFYRRLRG